MKKLFLLIAPVLLLSFTVPGEVPKPKEIAKISKDAVAPYQICVRGCSATGIRTYVSPTPSGTIYIHVNGTLVGTGTSFTVSTSATSITYSTLSGGIYSIIAGASITQLQALCGTANPCI